MKKEYLTLLLFFCSTITFSNTKFNDFDYSIVFIGGFKNDIVSLSINKILLVDQYKVANVDSIKKGHLSLTQSDKEIKIFYNGRQITKSKIPVDFVIDFDITVNKKLKKFKLDLRKGKVILVDYCINDKLSPNIKKISVQQIQEPVILM
ncbi:MAG: hypothetical protein ABR503_04580 [Chitinophagaceae bacterium]